MAKIEWEKRKLLSKAKRNLKDEAEWLSADRAAKWLAKAEGSSSKKLEASRRRSSSSACESH